MDVAYYSYVQIYVFRQKIDGHKMSDSLSVLHYIVHRKDDNSRDGRQWTTDRELPMLG